MTDAHSPNPEPDPPEESRPEGDPGRNLFPIIGIGASAGGLEAFTQLLTRIPPQTGMAFVLVQHLDPNHESYLVDLLSKSLPMPVVEVVEGMEIRPDRVHVIPPNTSMTVEGGSLRLKPRPEGSHSPMPINVFLRSLAEAVREKAIGIVLSGTGTDGTTGLAEIKAAGGITFAQDDRSAKHPGMPQSAVAEGVVDYVLPPEQMARELVDIGHHSYFSDGNIPREPSESQKNFAQILVLLRAFSGVDFSHYRDTTLKRRIQRRMVLHKQESMAAYARFLKGNRAELQSLYQEVLINVTRFFRDGQVFEALKARVFPEIHRGKAPGGTIRIWVAGCASGEEAYSLAMSLYEFQDGGHVRPAIRIFASDISETPSLERARAGLYPDSIETDVSPERLKRFFTREALGYRINKDIRDICIFAKHNVTVDPPFSKMDLISCRNVLIYLGTPLQRRVLPTFHYALNPSGFLVLGNSETVGRETDLFSVVDARSKIYSKKFVASRMPIAFSPEMTMLTAEAGKTTPQMPNPSDFEKAADRLLLRRFAPSGVLVNRDMDILQFRGRTSPYLEPPQGEATFNLVKMAPELLFLELRNAIHEADRNNAPVAKSGIRIREGKQIREVGIEVIPVRPPEAGENCFLILFHEGGLARASAEASLPPPKDGGTAERNETDQLRLELNAAREYLQTIREQHDAVSEELKSSNEEILSSNEELQSTNEELETAKEELQSTNEELTTMNDELRIRNLELNQLNNDLNNLFTSVNVPILILGNDSRIRRFTPAAARAFNLKPQDVGRPVGDLRPAPGWPDLERMVAEVIEKVSIAGAEVRDREGRWQSLKIQPYRTSDNRIEGAVVVLVDIDDSKRTQDRLAEAAEYAGSIVSTVREPILILDEGMRIHSANGAFYRMFGGSPEDTESQSIYQLARRRWDIPRLRSMLQDIIPKNTFFDDFEVEQEVPGLGPRTLQLNARRLVRDDGKNKFVLLAFEDITERKRELRHSENRYRRLFETAYEAILVLDPVDARILEANPAAEQLSGHTREELENMRLWELGLFRDEADCRNAFAELRDKGRIHYDNLPFRTKDARQREVEVSNSVYSSDGGIAIQCHIRDITERQRAERELKLFKFICDQSIDPCYLLDRGGHIRYVNRSAYARLGYAESELLDRAMGEVDPHLVGDAFASLFDSAQNGRIPSFESLHLTREKAAFPVECSVTGLRYEGDSFLLIVAREITDRKLAEEALHKSEEKLRRAQKMEDIGKLAGGVAHDFNNLLTAINGYTEVSQNQLPPEDPMQENLREIRKAGERAASLTRKLLAYSRKQVLMPKVLNLNFLVADMQQMLASLIGESRELLSDLDPGLGQVKADPGEIEQVLLNLVLNARDAMPAGGRITIQTRNLELDREYALRYPTAVEGSYVLLSVSDTGTGMDDDVLERIFDPFFTTKAVGKGSGLGLSMVQGMIAQSGGHLTVESEPGKGTRFNIYLPRIHVEEAGAQATGADRGATLNGGETILLVDDEDMVRALTRQILAMYGYAVLEARDGKDALKTAEQFKGPINLLLTDLVMPGMTGRQLAEKFAALRPQSRIAFMSGYDNENIARYGLGGGEYPYVKKPFTPEKLARTVREALAMAMAKGAPG